MNVIDPISPRDGADPHPEVGAQMQNVSNLPQKPAQDAIERLEGIPKGVNMETGVKSAPARSAITTPEELDALPVGSVVLGRARIYGIPIVGQRISVSWDPDAMWWINSIHYYDPEAAYAVLKGPLTVLYRPDQSPFESIDVDELARVLQREFGSFLAHDPHNPEKFWGIPARAVKDWLTGDSR